jgi:transcription elongation factor Elf1
MKHAIKIKELPVVIGFEDSLHFKFNCPHCGQERRNIHAFFTGKPIDKVIECVVCKKKYQLLVSSGFIRSTMAWIRRMQLKK